MFPNGKINCNGKVRSFREGRRRLRRYVRVLLHVCPSGCLTDVKRLTASACHTLSGPLAIEKLAVETKASYHPEIFPSLIIKQHGVTFSCFYTGKIVITGIKTSKDIDDVVYPTLIELELYTTT